MLDVPKSLYKYLPPQRACDVLEKLLIRFSQASAMNDESEFKPPIKGLAAREQLMKVMLERFEVKFPGRIAEVRSKLPAAEAEQLIQSCISNGADEAEANRLKSIETIYEMNDKNFGILSLSESPDSYKMWELYTDKGTGLMIEFDSSHSWFRQKKENDDDLRHLRRVKYVSNRQDAYLLNLTAEDYLYTKEEKWSYEKEWRIILNFNGAANNVGKDGKGTDILLFAIPPDCVLSVVVGYKAMQDFIDRIQATLSATPSLSHVHFKRQH
jgi:hypothetical protein